MKKLLSLSLALLMILSAATVLSLSTAAAEGFKEGDVLYFKVENPANWATNATLYANFTTASREDNGDKSVVIAEADKTQYDPVTGVVYDSEKDVYKYTVTAADAGKTAMRFWRGNTEKLWNETVVITADDLADGKNTAVVTDWSDTGRLISTYDFDPGAKLSLSAAKGEIGDSFDIAVTYANVPDSVNFACEILINDVKVADSEAYTFTPTENGVYSIKANVTATHWQTGAVMSKATVTGTVTVGSSTVGNLTGVGLYAHASRGSKDQEGWVKWSRVGDDYYLFLPVSVKAKTPVELFNAYDEAVTLDSLSIPANSIADFTPEANKSYVFRQGRTSRNLIFMYSDAEAALFVNNPDDFGGMDFFSYLQQDKEHYVAATGVIGNDNGTLTNAEVKKMKGRGNTSWDADKKGFNVTFKDALSVAGMEPCKKFSLVSNFQDATLMRNRILYDMADAVGVPYASDSRFIDLYTNGTYQGSYQLCQKIDVGKNTLMPDIADDDYLDKDTDSVKPDFSFVAEIDASPAADDFHFTVGSGINLTMKSPELDATDPNVAAVRNYITTKFDAMWNKLNSDADDLDDYIDVDSLAKVYLINELGKNWDSGATSFFLTYKPDKAGKYKFFASPVWDYDNSLGNAAGVDRDLQRMGCNDYTLPSGWFSTIKGGYGNMPNFLAVAAKNSIVMNRVYPVWFEDFLPAIDILACEKIDTGELYSVDVYAAHLRDSAAMNYKVWQMITSGWICDHSSLRRYTATYTKNDYGQVTGVGLTQDSRATSYDQYTFDGQVDYMLDWTTSRAAWISAQYIAHYTPEPPIDDPTEPVTEPPTEPEPAIIPYPYPLVPHDYGDSLIAEWFFDDNGKTEGDKLTEYGSSDGYAATFGNGTLTMSVDGEKLRALEWSVAEYGPSGKSIVPIMGAGKKNMWNAPYMQLAVSTKGYENINLTMYMAGSNKAPASWKLQYSTDGETFADTEASFTFSAENRKLMTAYLDRTALPAAVADADTLILRLVPVSMTTVGGGNALETNTDGEIAVNCIIVKGTRIPGERLYGDADMDGVVSILDATRIQRYLADLSTDAEIDKEAANVTEGGLSILDATAIQRWLADFRENDLINQPIKA